MTRFMTTCLFIIVWFLPGCGCDRNPRLVFSSDREGDMQVFTMNADGSGPTNISNSTGDDFDPSASPDGSRVTFFSNRNGNNEIFIMNADGTGQTNITCNPAHDGFEINYP